MADSTFGPYQIEGTIGRGGMAIVFKARDTRTDDLVALKILYDHILAQKVARQRFLREAELLHRLDHPNIVPVVEHGEIKGRTYLAMRYMANGSLADRLQNPTSIGLMVSTKLLKEVAKGLDYAHEQGIIHRDIKLENILLDADKRPALSDFGIAKLANSTRLTATGFIAGTPNYMSPEQALGWADIDHRTDIYSLGIMAYLMLTGFHPFTGSDALVVLNQHINMAPPPPTSVNDTLPSALDAVLLQGLAKDRTDRPNSAGEFIQEIENVIRSSQLASNTQTLIDIAAPNPQQGNQAPTTRMMTTPSFVPQMEQTSVQAAEASPSRRGIGLLGLLGVAILALIMVFVVSANSQSNPPMTPNETEIAAGIFGELTQTADAEVFLSTQSALSTEQYAPRSTFPPTWTPTYTPTITNTPTITSTPSNTPIVTSTLTPTPSGNAIVIGEQGVNMRTGPSVGYQLLRNLPQGTPLMLIGRTSDANWYEARAFTGLTGWVFSNFIETEIEVLLLPVTWIEEGTSGDSGGSVLTIPTTGNPPANPTNTPVGGSTSIPPTNTPVPTSPPGGETVVPPDFSANARANQDGTLIDRNGVAGTCQVVAQILQGQTFQATARSSNNQAVYGKLKSGIWGWVRTNILDFNIDINTLPVQSFPCQSQDGGVEGSTR